MGIAFSHCSASWSYSGFMSFRERLATAIGITLRDMEGFNGSRPWSDVSDPLTALLNHSDCDGELSAEECKTVAPRLREVLEKISAEERSSNGHAIDTGIEYDVYQGLELCRGMELAASNGESLQFR